MQNFIGFAQENWALMVLWISAAATLYYTETKKAGKSVNTTEATRMINRDNALILDIREQKEFAKGHIAGAYNLPAGRLYAPAMCPFANSFCSRMSRIKALSRLIIRVASVVLTDLPAFFVSV